MTIKTMMLIVTFFAVLAIGMTLVAAYYVAAYKDEKRKNELNK
jgi:hypothetical protein